MSTSSRERVLAAIAGALILCAPATARGQAAAREVVPAARDTSISALTAPVMASLEERRRELDAHEARLSIWEKDLARRAGDEAYFTDLEGYVTPAALGRSFLLGVVVSVVLTLLALRVLERRGLWRAAEPSRAAGELRELEARVLTGLREFDGLLSRVYERLQSSATGTPSASPVLDRSPAAVTPSGRPPRAPRIRDEVASLSRDGASREEIGRRLGLGHAEVDFILRTEASR